MRRLFLILLVALLATTSFSVTSVPVQAQDDEAPLFVVVAHGGDKNPFWKVAVRGFMDGCEQLQVRCEWLSDPLDNIADMASYWETALEMNPAGIATTVPDPELIRDVVTKASELKIPVISINTPDPNRKTDKALPMIDFYIGTDDYLAGVNNAKRVLAQSKADGVTIKNAVCPLQEQGHAGLMARCQGVKDVFEPEKIPVETIDISYDVSASAEAIVTYLDEKPETNAIFLLGPSVISSFSLVIEEKGLKPGEMYAVGHDTSTEAYQLIQEGFLLQTVDQQPYLQGYMAIIWLYQISQYGMLPGQDVLTGPSPIDLNNVETVIELTAEGIR
ncbi:MAG: substrate-binding domain-containing protein [Anaerolinea sp.]|nr:substrate-binding domain-containing protein [Anaerolinea sp.]MCC6972878.1 substrate-binding domain-containing protein [Anaerolineae bacterium]CAG0995330.1 hypothetical protein ANRL4_02731 [Anaerolineae bacterium]